MQSESSTINDKPRLTFDEYADFAVSTISPITPDVRRRINLNAHMLRGVLEALVQVGSDIDKIKKSLYYGKPLDADDLACLPLYERLAGNGLPMRGMSDQMIDLMHAVFGIVGESAGELTQILLDPIRLEKPYAEGGIVEEVGDTLWYLPLALSTVGVTLADAAQANNRKLAERYKSGAFSQGEALNRDTGKEIKALEGQPSTNL